MVSAPAPPADRSKEIRRAAEAVAGRAAEAGRGGAQEARGSATAAASGSDALAARNSRFGRHRGAPWARLFRSAGEGVCLGDDVPVRAGIERAGGTERR